MNVKKIIDSVSGPDPIQALFSIRDGETKATPELVTAISSSPGTAFIYALSVLQGPFPEGERAMYDDDSNNDYMIKYLDFLHSTSINDYLQACIRLGIDPQLID